MTFKPRVWYPIAAFLAVANVGSVYFAAQAAEPIHGALHAAFGVAFAIWADRLRRRRHAGLATGEISLSAQQGLELEMDQLRQELGEAQERLDFAERLLAQRPERQP